MSSLLSNVLLSASKANPLFDSAITAAACRHISTTGILYAEPLKKRKRMDPAMLRIKVERKIIKVERQVEKMQKEPRHLIPILEYQLTSSDRRKLEARPTRSLEEFGISESTVTAAERLWAVYRSKQESMLSSSIVKLEKAQKKALEELKQLDEQLYNRTLQADKDVLVVYSSSHVRRETAPNPNYTPPDGYVKDTTKEWKM